MIAPIVIVLDSVIALFFAMSCLVVLGWHEVIKHGGMHYVHKLPARLMESYELAWSILASPVIDDPLRLYGATTLIPTVAYLSILAVLFVAWVAWKVARKAVLYYAERVTEAKPEESVAFTLVGVVFTVFALSAQVIHTLFNEH